MTLHIGIEARDALRPHPGGIGRYAVELALGIRDELQAPSAVEAYDINLELLFPWRRLLHAKHRPAGLASRWYGRKAQPDFDIVHATGCKFPKWRAGLQIATVHDLYNYAEAKPANHRKHAELEIPSYIAEAQRIICVSETTRQHLHQLFSIPEAHTVAIPLGVNEKFRQQPAAAVQDFLQRAKLPKQYLLFVGRLRKNKNFSRLAQAYAAAKLDLPLLVAGNLSSEEQTEFKEIVAGLGLQNQVYSTGFIADADLPSLVSGAAAVTFPSTFEGFGLPVLEAMACGAPVLTSAGVATEEVANGHACLVDPYDIASISQGLSEVLERSEVQRQAALSYAQACTWQKTAAATLAFYRQAVA